MNECVWDTDSGICCDVKMNINMHIAMLSVSLVCDAGNNIPITVQFILKDDSCTQDLQYMYIQINQV